MTATGGARSSVSPAYAPSRAAAAAEVVRACRRLDARGLVAGAEGNVSVRLAADRLLVTPSGRTKGELTTADLVEVDLDGCTHGPGHASSELRMHLRIYAERPDVGAVVHAHPPTATGFGVAGEDLLAPVLPEIILLVGGVPLVPFAVPGGDELADVIAPYIRRHHAILLANHGVTTVGASVDEALQRMESVEQAARIVLTARQLGRVHSLTPEQQRQLTPDRASQRSAPDHTPRIDA